MPHTPRNPQDEIHHTAPAPSGPPAPPSGDDWSRAEMWVMNTLQALTSEMRDTRETLQAINVRLENHSVKLAFIGALAGLAGGIIASLVVGLIQHSK